MSYEYEIRIVGHPRDEEWFCRIQPLCSNLGDVISELWGLDCEVDPDREYSSGDHEFKVSGALFLDYMERHRPDARVEGYLHELIAAIKKSQSPEHVRLSITVEHP